METKCKVCIWKLTPTASPSGCLVQMRHEYQSLHDFIKSSSRKILFTLILLASLVRFNLDVRLGIGWFCSHVVVLESSINLLMFKIYYYGKGFQSAKIVKFILKNFFIVTVQVVRNWIMFYSMSRLLYCVTHKLNPAASTQEISWNTLGLLTSWHNIPEPLVQNVHFSLARDTHYTTI